MFPLSAVFKSKTISMNNKTSPLSSQTFLRNSVFSRRQFLNKSALTLSAIQLAKFSAMASAAQNSGLAQAWNGVFRIGAALSSQSLDQQLQPSLDLLAREFNSITPENCMKWEEIRPGGQWYWETADRFVDFGTANDMYMVGHTLVWHSQIPRSAFQDAAGNDLGRSAMLAKMEDHIDVLAGRYKGRIAAWDVVNEAIDEGNGWRKSPWFNIIGDDYMEHAFRFAHAAAPDAHLMYNDYNMHNPQKRQFLVNVFHDYLERGVPIHGVGLQGHVGLDYPDLEEWERSIAAYAELGLKVHITELEVDVLPNPYNMSAEISNRFEYSPENDPYRDGLPEAIQQQLADRYEQLFRILLKYRNSIKRVTFWGLDDGTSWKNNFPIGGRTNYPLLFDRELQPKSAYFRLLDLAGSL
jgi:endo-1,4-beta-xylanase